MNQLYTTPEAAKETGIPEGTIRAWLSRYPEAFISDVHLVIENGKKFWTEKGIELLQSRRATENATPLAANSDAVATEDVTDNAATSDAGQSLHDAMLNAFLGQVSREMAAAFCQQLPGRTLQEIHRMLHSPLQQERETVTQSLQEAMQLLPSPGKRNALPPAMGEAQ
ncbi:hypothetical protein [Iningainema tapete]|uniref:Uncharacterized protein n=1 Tax=Iningainema tapete BLCC-T55 TaxID=2748662 RepID=A0A8J6XH33_9CYAN|nr:hypothetical protein [Iningainema tapete]MBD2773185.1 hypothetical protein [Iningainema tapete BLCC-T55]